MRLPVIVLCGGTSNRLSPDPAVDKTREALGDATVLDHLLEHLPMEWSPICVGEPRRTTRPARWTGEEPVGGGPVAAIAAGLALVSEPLVVVVAGDLPFAAPALRRLVARLAATVPTQDGGRLDLPHGRLVGPELTPGRPPDTEPARGPLVEPDLVEPGRLDAAIGYDPAGAVQPLLAAYRTGALRGVLPREPAGARARALLENLRVAHVVCTERECLDVDTPRDLQRARLMVAP